MKKLLLLIAVLFGSGLLHAQHQNMTVQPNGTGTGTINTTGITYYLWPSGSTIDFTQATVLGVGGGGGGGNPAGPSGSVQFNNGGSFGGIAAVSLNSSNGTLNLVPNGAADALDIVSQSGHFGLLITGGTTTGSSFGEQIDAGTNAADFGFKVTNQPASATYFEVRGDGAILLPQLVSQATIGTDSTGKIVPGTGGGGGVSSLTGGTGITLTPSTITSTGSIAFNTGASLTLTGVHTYNAGSFVPLVVNAFNGFGGETINGSSTASGSFGLSIAAGTNTSDFPLQITNQAGSATGEFIRGDMQVSFPHSLSSAGLVQTTSGGVISAFAFGTNGQVLGTTGSAFQWVSSLSNPMSAVGDIIVGGTSGAATRLAAGSNGQVLELSGGTPTWQTVTGTGTVTHSVGALTSGAIVIGNGGGDVQVAAPTISSNTITSASSTDLTLSSNGTTQNVNLDAFGTTGNVNAINTSAHANINIQSTAATSTSNTDYLQFTLNDSVGLINSAFISSAFTNTTRATDASYINFNNWVGGSFGEAARVSSPGNFLVGTTSDTGVVGPGMIKSSTTAAANTMVLETTSAVATSNGGQFLFRLNDSAGLVNAATIGFGIDATTHSSDATHITFNSLVASPTLSEVGRFSAPGNFLVGTTSDSGLTGSGGGLIVNNGALIKGYLQTSFAGTVGALNIAGSTSNPSLPVEGDIWENKTSHHFFGYLNGTVTQIDGGGGGGGSPAGTTNDIQFNTAGSFAANTGVFTYNPSTGTETIQVNGVTTTQNDALMLVNVTAASSGISQWSPSLSFGANSWTGSASQQVRIWMDIDPSASSTQGTFTMQGSNNGGTAIPFLSLVTSTGGTNQRQGSLNIYNTATPTTASGVNISNNGKINAILGVQSGGSAISAANTRFLGTLASGTSLLTSTQSSSETSGVNLFDVASTWNNASNTPTALKINITDTASNAASKLADFQIGGQSEFAVSKIGRPLVHAASNGSAGTFTLATGTATVSNTSITANSVVVCSVKTSSGTLGLYAPLIVCTASTGFVATGAVTDNSTYNYIVMDVN